MILKNGFLVIFFLCIGLLSTSHFMYGYGCISECKNMFVVTKWEGNKAVAGYLKNNEGMPGPGFTGNFPDAKCAKCGQLVSTHTCDKDGTPCVFAQQKEECKEHFASYVQYSSK